MRKIFKNRQILAWMFYDWANSAFATTIMAGFFPIFFKSFWSASDNVNVSTAKLAFANSLSGIIIAITAPVLGAIADKSGKKIRFLFFFTFIGATGAVALSFVQQGDWQNAILFYVVSSIGFFSSIIFYDSMLTDIVKNENEYDIVSSAGFSLGYLGGGLLFAFNVFWTIRPDLFGFVDKSAAVRASFISVGLWWIFFSLPLLFNGPQKTGGNPVKGSILSGIKQLRQTFSEIKHMKVIFTFLLAYWLYIDGVDTIIRMAADYGLSIGFSQIDLITALLLIQFLGFPFTYLIGFLAGKTGRKNMLFLTIGMYLIICIWAFFINNKLEFYLLAFLISTVQGGVQALSRSYFATLIPINKSAEYFGFYNMLGKFAVIFGPILMGITNLVASYFVENRALVSRFGILSISVLFITGAYFLYRVDEKKAFAEKKYL